MVGVSDSGTSGLLLHRLPADPTLRRDVEEIRRAGRERALRDHTWVKRFESAFLEMGLT